MYYETMKTAFRLRGKETMKKRFAKILALGLAAALTAGTPMSAVAAEIAPVDTSVTSEAVTAEVQSETELTQELTAVEQTATDLSRGTDPMTLNGMQQLGDGNWYYMENGQVSDKADGTLQPVGDAWMYVGKYRVDESYTGLCSNEAGSWYVKAGKVDFSYNGVVSQSKNGRTNWYYITDGKVDTSVNGLRYVSIYGNKGWYNFKDGMVTEAYRQLVEYNGSWWYVGENAKVDFSYTGVCQNSAGTWYVKNGQVDFGFSGVLEGISQNYSAKPYKYYFVNGKTDARVHGVYYTTVNGVTGWYGFYKGELATTAPYGVANLLPNEVGWWCIDTMTGQVDFTKNGLQYVQEENGTGHRWYVRGGQVDFSYNGAYAHPYDIIPGEKYCWIVGGQVDQTCSGVYYLNINGTEGWYAFSEGEQITYSLLPNPDNGTWWYVGGNGMVDFSYTGIGQARDHSYHTAEDRWYVRNGQVDFSYAGVVYQSDRYYLVQDGRVQKENNSLAYLTLNGETAWWQVTDGYISTEYDKNDNGTLVFYDGSWWYVKNHKVDFSYTGFVNYNDSMWYVENGRYSYETTGFVMADGFSCYYVTNGRFDDSCADVVYGSINGEDAWWVISGGRCGYWKTADSHDAPDTYAANANGLWACNDGRVNFSLNGTFTGTETYYVGENQMVTMHYVYQVENGQVTAIQVETE